MNRIKSRRALSGVALAAIAASGPVWSGCGDDAQDQANEIIDDTQQQVEDALENADQESIDEAVQDAQDAGGAVADEAKQQLEDAQQELEQAQNP